MGFLNGKDVLSSPEGEYSLRQGGGSWGKVNPQTHRHTHTFYPHVNIHEIRVSLPMDEYVLCGKATYICMHIHTHWESYYKVNFESLN